MERPARFVLGAQVEPAGDALQLGELADQAPW
jgi:hypothetical protein